MPRPRTRLERSIDGRPPIRPDEGGDKWTGNQTLNFSGGVRKIQILNHSGGELQYIVTEDGDNNGATWHIPDGVPDTFVGDNIVTIQVTVTGTWYMRAWA